MSDPRPAQFQLAQRIARTLAEADLRENEGVGILGMALGIYIEAQPGSNRDMQLWRDGLLTVAQMAFDAMRKSQP